VAALSGNELKDAWYFVLTLMSKLDYLYSVYSTNNNLNPSHLR